MKGCTVFVHHSLDISRKEVAVSRISRCLPPLMQLFLKVRKLISLFLIVRKLISLKQMAKISLSSSPGL